MQIPRIILDNGNISVKKDIANAPVVNPPVIPPTISNPPILPPKDNIPLTLLDKLKQYGLIVAVSLILGYAGIRIIQAIFSDFIK